MNSDQLKMMMKKMMGPYAADDFPYARTADALSAAADRHGVELTPYGFVMWSVDHYGCRCAYRNMMACEDNINGYASEAARLKDDMPAMLVNAHMYVSRIMANIADMDTCFRQLEGMTFPYVLYILFAGSGQEDVVARYRERAAEMARRYPSMYDRLPQSYRNAGRELLAQYEGTEACADAQGGADEDA